MVRFEKLATSLTLAASLTLGCSPERGTIDAPESGATIGAFDDSDIPTPTPPCPITTDEQTSRIESAQRCKRAQKVGRVALIGFDTPPDVLRHLAHTSEKLAKLASNGLIQIDIEPVQASKKAISRFRKRSPDCVIFDDLGGWSSYIAYQEDRRLKGYDYIIGASSTPNCQDTVLGASISGKHFIELFAVTKKNDTLNTSLSFSEELTLDRNTLVHELVAHGLIGRGHANKIAYEGNDPLKERIETVAPYKQFDLMQYALRGQFKEYGDTASIAGLWVPGTTPQPATDPLLNPMQLAWLKQPDILTGQVKNPFIALTKKPAPLERTQVYHTRLPKALHMSDFTSENPPVPQPGSMETYNSVALVAGAIGRGYTTDRVDMYLTSNIKSTLFLGTIYKDAVYDTASWELKLSNRKRIEITFTSSGTTLKLR